MESAIKIDVSATEQDDLGFLRLRVNTNIPYSSEASKKICSLIEQIPVNHKGWTKEWPTEPKTSWFFYGWTSAMNKRDEEPKYHIVHVWKTGHGVCYVCDGHFMYQQEGAEGIFFQIDYPPIKEQK